MISVIYCTINPNPKHTEHIKRSSGVKDIEVIEYINKGEGLTKFYNKGLKEAKNDIIVFMHDDVSFNKDNWGKKLLNHFNNTDYGILGVAGTTNMPETGRWWDDTTKMMGKVRHAHEGKFWDSKYCEDFGENILESTIVDGLFFAVDRKRIKKEFDFGFKGFHFYEIDFCFNNHLNGVKVGVMSNIRLTHKSIGMTNQEWENNRLQFVEKYKSVLPYTIPGTIFYDDKKITIKETPKISCIIPTKGNVELLKDCITSIFEKDNYPNIEILIADTGSKIEEREEIKSFIKSNSEKIIKLIEYDFYNFSIINNDVVENHVSKDTELLLFCNNDIKLINDAITRMVDVYLKNKNVGTIGARLHFGNNTVQHSGIIVFLQQNQQKEYSVNLSHKGLKSNYGYHRETTKVFGNTAAFMVVTKKLFDEIGGFNRIYKECFEDVEFNIQCINKNKENVFVSDAVCYHYESQTRNKSEEKLKRESEDYTKRIIPFIIKNKKTYHYFENVKAEQLEQLFNRNETIV